MTEQSAGLSQQISEQLTRELWAQDQEAQVRVKRASLGWLYLQMPYRMLCNSILQKSPEARSGLALTPSRFTPLHNIRYGIYLQVITTIFAQQELIERERQIDMLLAPLDLNLGDYPFLEYKLQTPQEAEAEHGEPFQPIEIPLWSEILMAPEPDNPVPLDENAIKRPFVVTFYSFKGGVGRSTALAFVANILATRGHRVVMMDFDLEAPGLSFLSSLGISEATTYGVLDYLHQRYLTPDQDVPTIADCIRQIDIPSRGELYLVPAGEYDEGYIHRLADLDIRILYQREKNPIHQLLKDVKRYLDPDVILIDARTGFTEIGAIALFDKADLGVICFSPTDQSFAGLQWVVKAASKQRSYRGFPDLRFLLTPMPPVASSQQQLWVARTAAWIADNWEIPASVVVEDLYHQIPYNPNITTLGSLFDEMPPGLLEPYIPVADTISASLPQEEPAIPELADQRSVILSQLAFQTRPTQKLAAKDIPSIFQRTGDFSRFLEDRTWFIRGAQGSGKTMLFRLFVERPDDARRLSRLYRSLLRNVHFIPGHGPAGLHNSLLTSNDFSNYEPRARDLAWWNFWEGYLILQLVVAFPELQSLSDLDPGLAALAKQEKPQHADITTWLDGYIQSRVRLSVFKIQDWLQERQQKVWLLYDELDVAFGQDYNRRHQALDALTGWWMEMGSVLGNIVPKIFLREDIWNELGLTNRGSASTRSIQLRWEDEDLWRLALRQALNTSPILADLIGQQLGVGLTGLDNIEKGQLQKSLYPVWGERMESGNKAYTHTWVSHRISDGKNNRLPRSLLQLLQKSLDIEKEAAERKPSDVLLHSQALIEALLFVSAQRVAEVRTTYPEFADPLDKLRGERSPITLDHLRDIWQKDGDELKSLVTRMSEAGILQEYLRSPDTNVEHYSVAELYLYGLGMKRQGQR